MKMNKFHTFLFLLLIYAGSGFGLDLTELYNTLGVNASSSQEEIKTAYKRLAMKWHPDRNPSPEAHAKMVNINRAYEILSDPDKRDAYEHFKYTDSTYEFTEETYEFTFGYQFDYGPGFFYQYHLDDSFEIRTDKPVWNALKVLAFHSHIPFNILRTQASEIDRAYKRLKKQYKKGLIPPIIFNDINRSYNVLHSHIYRNSKKEYLSPEEWQTNWTNTGFWISVAVLLIWNAIESHSMEMDPPEVIKAANPSVVEHIQRTPLKQTNCPFVFTE